MGLIKLEDVNDFISQDVGITIYDKTWKDQSPFRSEKVKKVQLCPSKTHLRIYFDRLHFFAIPRVSEVTVSDQEWAAFDKEGGLHYVIRKE